MASVFEHYEQLLAPIYLWMAGGAESALAQGARDMAPFAPAPVPNALAVDLGAGFGMHAIPLSRAGYRVTAVDSSAALLAELQALDADGEVRVVSDDLRFFRRHVNEPAHLITCMGDTLAHLAEFDDIERLFVEVREALGTGGIFVLTFRDQHAAAAGEARFIPVRSDADRIHTCFLESGASHVRVYDLVHERQGDLWRLRVSSYPKLRLTVRWVLASLARAGLMAEAEPAARGMTRIVATPAP
jgi:SAM-dependent methyltransferase